MTAPIKPQLKFDTTGVGHDPAKEFTNNWWDRAFNKAAQGIKVNQSEVSVMSFIFYKKKSLLSKKICISCGLVV